MSRVHLVEGPVGAGKSTFSARLAAQTGAVHIALDAWFAALFSPDRPQGDVVPWYVERKERLLEHIWAHCRQLLAAGKDVVLELGLIQRQGRQAFCDRVRDEGHELSVVVIDVPRDVRRERVRCRNAEQGPTFSMIVPDHVFELASDLWEAPDASEVRDYRIEFVNSGGGGTC